MESLAMAAIFQHAATFFQSIDARKALAAAETLDLIEGKKLKFDKYHHQITEKLLKVKASERELAGALKILSDWVCGSEGKLSIAGKLTPGEFICGENGLTSCEHFDYENGSGQAGRGLFSWVRQNDLVQFAVVKATVAFELHRVALDIVQSNCTRIKKEITSQDVEHIKGYILDDLMIQVYKRYEKQIGPSAEPVVQPTLRNEPAVQSSSHGQPALLDGGRKVEPALNPRQTLITTKMMKVPQSITFTEFDEPHPKTGQLARFRFYHPAHIIAQGGEITLLLHWK